LEGFAFMLCLKACYLDEMQREQENLLELHKHTLSADFHSAAK
tara:strand:+ start:163 stop:291 length:129 start_codon:yes stop_codon:yes gene_type:complete